jgi:RNA polymerase sigma factor (sigma-70 family)
MDLAALRTQIELHHTESYGWALACCRHDPGEAETVLQTAYLKILEQKAVFNGSASFKTWLFSVIRNTARDDRRRTVLRALGLARYAKSNAGAGSQMPADEAAYRSEVRGLFRQALSALPNRQREVLQLVFYHDLSLVEAAQVMRVSVGSARTHYERGKKRLRQQMEGVAV